MLQIRVSVPDFSFGIDFDDPVVLENASDISLSKTVNSSDEGISFTLPLSDPKSEYVTYTRWWECWDTDINQRINYGPIHSISRTSGESRKVAGPGRSALFADYYRSLQSYYQPIDQFWDDLRFENLSIQPRTRTIINTNIPDDGVDNVRDDYYSLSKRSKDFAIDEQTGYIAIGKDAPSRGTIKTSKFWAGTYKSDWLEIDLGIPATITKAKILLPWWGGSTTNNNRAYDWKWQYAEENSALYHIYGEDSEIYKTWHTVFETPTENKEVLKPPDGKVIYFGEDGYERNQVTASGEPITARFWKLNITNTYAWYTASNGLRSNEWNWECKGSDVLLGHSKKSPRPSSGPIIPTTNVNVNSDCYASAVEVSLFKTIIARDELTDLVYQEIQNDNKQIDYSRTVLAEEMRPCTFKTSSGSKVTGVKFEPGTFFRKANISVSGTDDIYDEWNVKLWNDRGDGDIKVPAWCRLLKFTESTSRVLTVNAWRGRLDPYSKGGSYVFCTEVGDTATISFRGVSFKWYATVPGTTPVNKNPDDRDVNQGLVRIELRYKTGGTHLHRRTTSTNWVDPEVSWSAWETLESAFWVPTNINGEKIWEITPESGILENDVSYQIRITNLNGGFVSIDAIAGYWSGSLHEINEDNERIGMKKPTEVTQYFDKKYTEGSAYGWKKTLTNNLKQSLAFTGDRIIIYSKKGPNYGYIEIELTTTGGVVRIPVGTTHVNDVDTPQYNSDGRVRINLNRATYINQYVIFDSNDYFWEAGLPWGKYQVNIYKDSSSGPIWIDGMAAHETNGLSVKFLNTSYLDIIKSTAEALQMEWEVTEAGLRVVPRVGYDTDWVAAEGRGTTIKIDEAQDATKVATMLLTTGADIEGLPLWTLTENKVNRDVMGRTIQRTYDELRNVADYFTLVGVSRGELLRRREPDRKITVSTKDISKLQPGDTFIVKTPELEKRVRANTITRTQNNSGTEYTIECTPWPVEPIVDRVIKGVIARPIWRHRERPDPITPPESYPPRPWYRRHVY